MAAGKPRLLLDVAVLAVAAGIAILTVYNSGERLYKHWREGSGDVPVHNASRDMGTRETPAYSLSRIIDAHLYGQVDDRTREKTAPVPETKLRLNLLGLIASADQRLARAFIGVDRSRAKSYSIGDEIDKTGAAVEAVEPDRVLLKRGGAVESLVLQAPGIAAGGTGFSADVSDHQSSTLPQASPLAESPGGNGRSEPANGSGAFPGNEDQEDTNIRRDDRTIELRKPF